MSHRRVADSGLESFLNRRWGDSEVGVYELAPSCRTTLSLQLQKAALMGRHFCGRLKNERLLLWQSNLSPSSSSSTLFAIRGHFRPPKKVFIAKAAFFCVKRAKKAGGEWHWAKGG